MLAELRELGLLRAAAALVAGLFVIGTLAWRTVLWMDPPHVVRLNVRWKADVDASRRAMLEQQLHLTQGEPTEGSTWAYRLPDPSTNTIRAIVQHPSVDDTAHINRVRFRPELSQDRERRAIAYAVPIGGIGAIGALLWIARRHGQRQRTRRSPPPERRADASTR
jgi:hypothetical protein